MFYSDGRIFFFGMPGLARRREATDTAAKIDSVWRNPISGVTFHSAVQPAGCLVITAPDHLSCVVAKDE
jgi:hypothetical protein